MCVFLANKNIYSNNLVIFITVRPQNQFHVCYIFGAVPNKHTNSKKSGSEMHVCCEYSFNMVMFYCRRLALIFNELEMSNGKICTYNFHQNILHRTRLFFIRLFFGTLSFDVYMNALE